MDPCSEDESEKDEDDDFDERVRWNAFGFCWTGWCSRLALGGLGEASNFTIMRVGVRLGKFALFMLTSFISFIGVAICH
jgi:hypothetical protein